MVYMKCRVYVYMNSVSPHEVQQVSVSATKYAGDMIVDKISGIITSTDEQ